ncbi:MAG: MMPL family transporter [Hyphomicrobiaceae bacterium]|nr:MMPL family transporter [Hyphomicrobiaceae bacterium]
MPSLGFGLERAGLPSLKNPKMSLLLIALVSLVAGLGLLRLQPAGSLSELFRSNSVEFANYQKLAKLFPTTEYDVMMLVQGKDLLSSKKLDDVRNIHLEMAFAEGVDSTISMFTLRGTPNKTGYAPPLFPADMPKGKAFEKLMKTVREHPQIKDKFLSKADKDGNQLALMVISLKAGSTQTGVLAKVIDSIHEIAEVETKTAGVTYMLTGAPVMQLEVRKAIKHDRITFNVIGFTFGVLISLFFFRRPTLVFISSICPAFAVLWIMGILGWIGQPINTFINVLPPLIMVITLSDSMHMVFSLLKGLRAGKSKYEAVKTAIMQVGPACVLTSLTTTVALLSMALTDSADIRAFALASAGGTLMAFFAVITLVPTLAMLLIGDEKAFLEQDKKGFNPLLWLEQLCLKLAAWVLPKWRGLAIVGLLIGVLFTGLHTQLEPRYRLSDQIPDTDVSMTAMDLIDAKLSGAQTINILVEWPKDQSFSSPKVIEAIGETHRLLLSQDKVHHTTSLETIRLYLKDAHERDSLKFFGDYVNKLPDGLKQRYVNVKAHAALVSGQIENLEAAKIAPVLHGLEPALVRLRAEYPGMRFTPAGLAVVSALQSTNMINQLNLGLMGAIVIVILLLGVAFRSLDAALLSIVPNLFPIVTVGAFLYLSGEGLQFAAVMGLTVAFGLAVDDTIHFLNRYELEQRKAGDVHDQVRETIAQIGPVLMLTTLVLLCGLSVTSLSDLPVTRLFGQLSMATLAAALVADMLILPAIIIAARKLKPFGHDFALTKNKTDAAE